MNENEVCLRNIFMENSGDESGEDKYLVRLLRVSQDLYNCKGILGSEEKRNRTNTKND